MADPVHIIWRGREIKGSPEYDLKAKEVRISTGREIIVIPMEEFKRCLVLS